MASFGIWFRLPWEHLIELNQRTALTGWNRDAGRDADAVVNDSKYIDVVLYAGLQAWDGAGGDVAWNPNF